MFNFYIFLNDGGKLADFPDFRYVKFLRNLGITILHISPHHLSHVARLMFDLHTIIFSRFRYLCVLVIMCVIS